MKKYIYFYLLLMPFIPALVGCYEDNSSLGTENLPDITIAEFQDTTMMSFSGKVLEIIPHVTTEYPESSLSYAWYCYPDKTITDENWENGYKNNLISEERNLAYEVNLPTGTYYIVYEVTSKENNYTRVRKFKLNTTTEFTGRFYVLKETLDGNSELDLVYGDKINADVITKVSGTPIAGKPVNLSYIYNQGYINETLGGSAGARAMYVFTDKDCRVYNTEDMMEILNSNTLSYSSLREGEKPCSAWCSFVLMMLSNEGFYYTQPYDADMGYTSAGKYGLPTSAGGSPWVVALGMDFVYWSESAHHLYMTDMNGHTPSPLEYEMPQGVNESDLTCISAGQNSVAGVNTNWFLVEDKITKERYLLLLENAQNVQEIRKLKSSLHIAKAEVVSACGLSAPVIYSIDENTLWRYHFDDGSETKLVLPGGIGEGETLSYVSNQYLNAGAAYADDSYDFDALIVGTQKGDAYNLYIYDDVVGGVPQKAVKPVTGIGKVKSIRFAAPISLGIFSYIMGGPIFPLCD